LIDTSFGQKASSGYRRAPKPLNEPTSDAGIATDLAHGHDQIRLKKRNVSGGFDSPNFPLELPPHV
jgi:hypothetical protein